MTTPGIGNPYWYEWYVGLNQVINMLNPDNRITYVIFQSDIYDTIDDVVVGYNDGYEEICYQVKHEIDSSNRVNLTFDKLLQQTLYKDGTLKKSLIGAIADGWKKASESSNIRITPVLYTNRGLGVKTTNRTFNGIDYKAHPLGDFICQVKQAVEDIDDINSVKFEGDVEINSQWEEFKSVLELDANTVLEFLKLLEIRSNTLSLDAFELQMVNNLEAIFSCTTETARKLFNNLVSQLRIWTTTRREKQKVYIEDVYTALSINNDEEIGNHILPPPLPFFNSRKIFCDDLKRNITECGSPIVFISGEPGSGKTSIISYLQSQNNFFTTRYHTFRPISPEQRFYNSDDGLCEPSSLWNDLLVQLRNYFKGELAQNNIPVLNALCSVEKMRSEVLRLAELLYIKNKQRIFICIDGIDHAARSKKDITFLSSLYLPEEIPEGVCIIIVGQPSELYPKYPVWLRTENNKVQEFKIPPLEADDIKQLLLSKKTPWVNSQIEALSSAIFSKTKGNNLSVVFAIEETMRCKKVEEVLSVLDTKHITGDINQYYDHIWSHVVTRINSMVLGVAFPSLVIASCIVLLNGRIDTALLNNAIKSVNLSNDDWNQLMEMLFPLIVPTKNYNQFSILNNDFRVFLMGIFETHKTKYQVVALELALYLKDCEGRMERSINLIPLLICAKREDLIAEAFDTKFVMESLAERVSLKTLNNYACLAFSSACERKNWTVFHSVYLAITTLRQHHSYYEYYSRVYQSNDNSDIKSLQIEEIQVVPLQLKTVKKYYDTLYLVKRLLQENDINSENRARNIYELWINSYTPLSFIQLLEDDKNKTLSVWEKNTIDNIMELWGNIAAQLGYPNMKIDSASEYSKEEQTGIINYNDAYFKYFFDSSKYADIPEILKTGPVSYKCLEEKLENIFLKGLGQYFKEVLHIVAEKSNNQNNQLMALVCLVERYKIDIKDIITNIRIDEPTFIMDDQSFNIVLWSVLYSYQNFIKETTIIIADIFKSMDKIEKKDKNYEYLKLLIRTGVIVGKSIGAYNSGKFVITEKRTFSNIIKEFFLTDIYRTYDFKNAFKILLKLVLHHVAIRDIVDISLLKEIAEEHLFNHHHIGMFYKTIILDFLVSEKEFSVIKKYIYQLYGEHGKSLFQTENYVDSHNQFKNYGILVLPDLMNEIDAKLKWDVVNYTGNRENALSSPFDYYKSIFEISPKLWKTLGVELYKLSYIANIASGNEMSWSIKENLYKSTCNCGFLDCWELSHIDADFCYQLDLIYNLIFDLVENVESEKDLLTLWSFSCGILSWYNSKDRIGIKNIYNASEQVAKRLGFTDFTNILEKTTPNYYKIAVLQNTNISLSNSYEDGWRKGFETIEEHLRGLSNDEIIMEINTLNFENKKSYIISFVWNILKDRNALSKEIAEKFLDIVIANLEEYEWEHHEYGRIIPDLIFYVGDAAAWKLANKIEASIINSKTYYIACLNIHFLIKTVTDNTNLEILVQRFQSELITQNIWATGINNIITDFDYFKPVQNVLPSPKSLEEFAFNILLEQCTISNIHRMEIASYGLYLLCRQHSCLFEFIAKSWECYTDLHKKTILMLAERWSQEIPEGFEHLINNLGEEYKVTNYLNRKLQLYYINKNIYFQKDIDMPGIEYTAEPIPYRLPTDVSPLLSDSSLDFCAKRFLSFMSDFMDCPYEDNYDIIDWLNNNCTDDGLSEDTDYFSRHGDGMEHLNKRGAIASQILYGEEKQGRWNDVPLTVKAQCLLSTDDSWIITTPPEVCEKSIWDIEKNLEKLLKENEYVQITQLLETITVDDIKNEELLLGSCIYYPISYTDGLVYERVAKVIPNLSFIRNKEITPTLSAKSLLAYEDDLFEPIEEEIYYKGICLMRSIVGTGTCIYGNAFIYPSNFVKQYLNWYPSKNNPFEWIDGIGDTVMRFERKSYPFREATQENYFRQPMLCRWICDKGKINKYLNESLKIHMAQKIEPMFKLPE